MTSSVPRVFLGVAAAAALYSQTQTPPHYVISTVAGQYSLGDGGPATQALLFTPNDVAVDAAGNVYVADCNHYRVRKIAPDGTITTIAGGGTSGFVDGAQATRSGIGYVNTVAVDGPGNVYVANAFRIFRISTDGVISAFAGTGAEGYNGEGLPAIESLMAGIGGLAFDTAGNLVFAESRSHRVRKIGRDGLVRTIAGTGVAGFSGDGGPADKAQLSTPTDVAIDSSGSIYIADAWNHRIRRISASGVITTVAGTGTAGFTGDGGSATSARLAYPRGVLLDGSTIYIAMNHAVRRVVGGTISTVAGGNVHGLVDGNGTLARFDEPGGMAFLPDRTILVVDEHNNRIRKISGLTVSTLAGAAHLRGDNGPAAQAMLFYPTGGAFDAAGNYYIADQHNQAIRKTDAAGNITTFAGSGARGWAGDGTTIPARAGFNHPSDVLMAPDGTLYVSDQFADRIRRITASGAVSTYAGGGSSLGDSGPATSAKLEMPHQTALDRSGNLYVADTGHHRIRRITAQGVISTVAGTGTQGFSGDGGPAVRSALDHPSGVAIGAGGELFIADGGNCRIRKVALDGTISTIAGDGACGNRGDGGPATGARVRSAAARLSFDSAGNLLIADSGNHRIRRITSDGIIDTIAGSQAGFGGDGDLATRAQMSSPRSVVPDSKGNLWVTDADNHRIRVLTPVYPGRLAVVGGDRQTAAPGAQLPAPLIVRVTGGQEIALPNIAVTFAVTAGAATLTGAAVKTSQNGTASVGVRLGNEAGAVTVRASVEGVAPVTFTITVAPPVELPSIATDGVTSAGQSAPPVTAISPNALIRIRGVHFAAQNAALDPAALPDGKAPTELAGACAEIGASLAPLLSVSASEIVAIVPDVPGPAAEVRVVRNCGKADEQRSAAALVEVRPATPEFVGAGPTAEGRYPVSATPAKPGDTVTLLAIGLGATDPPATPGLAAAGQARAAGAVALKLGEMDIAAEYVGLAQGIAAAYHVVFKLPEGAPAGDLPISIAIGDYTSPAGAYLSVAAP